VTHHLPGDRGDPSLLPGQFAGGAEMLDWDMVAAAPDGVEVVWLGPEEWERAQEFDRTVVTGTDLLSQEAMLGLARLNPVVGIHHQQQPTHARRLLLRAGEPFACMSDLHGEVEAAWSGASPEVCNGWIDLSDIVPGVKGEWALWAARNHPQKGRLAAKMWASANRMPLLEVTDVPRRVVLDAMQDARIFVFLPQRLDACPRTLIEAEAAGCEIVTNHHAGRRQPGPLAEVMADQRDRFWSWV
jgi:hypothetical protein